MGGEPVAPILARLSRPVPAGRLATDARSLTVLRWLRNHGLIEDVPDSAGPREIRGS